MNQDETIDTLITDATIDSWMRLCRENAPEEAVAEEPKESVPTNLQALLDLTIGQTSGGEQTNFTIPISYENAVNDATNAFVINAFPQANTDGNVVPPLGGDATAVHVINFANVPPEFFQQMEQTQSELLPLNAASGGEQFCDNMADIPLDASDEDILKFLESQGGEDTTPPPVLPITLAPPRTKKGKKEPPVKCKYCGLLFTNRNFKEHICDYDKDHNLIMPGNATEEKNDPSNDTPPSPAKLPQKAQQPQQPAAPPEASCARLLRENQIRIRRFLKDELKYDSVLALKAVTSTTAATPAVGAPGTGEAINKKYSHVCSLCDRSFVHASGLLRHMEKHALDLIPANPSTSRSAGGGLLNLTNTAAKYANSLRAMVKCPVCGRVFFDPKSAHEHYCDMHYSIKVQPQKESNAGDDKEFDYDKHVREAIEMLQSEFEQGFAMTENGLEEPEKYPLATPMKITILSCVLQCEFCDFLFSEVSYLLMHSAWHLASRPFECFACGIYVRTSKEICTHWQAECVYMRENLKMNNANALRYFVCNVCEEKFQGLDQLHEHRYTRYHFFPRYDKAKLSLQLPCEHCETVSLNALDCVDHFVKKHAKKYKREKDSASASAAPGSKSRQYLCDVCGKSYTQSSHLWQHLRFHQGVKPFACKEPGCNRKFTIRPDLNDHIRKCHTGERPYHCLVCGKRFLTGSVFYQHRLIHRGERRYECDQCTKRFYRADALKNHQRIHTGEKPFGCLFCTKHFRQRGDRDKHIRARHSSLDANARLMMQMQKLKLETEAAAAEALRRAGVDGKVDIASVVVQNAELMMLGDAGIAQNFLDNIKVMTHGNTTHIETEE